ncbi:MAG: hypothetical protein ACRC41_02105 [Sarcina sp.]
MNTKTVTNFKKYLSGYVILAFIVNLIVLGIAGSINPSMGMYGGLHSASDVSLIAFVWPLFTLILLMIFSGSTKLMQANRRELISYKVWKLQTILAIVIPFVIIMETIIR